MRGQQMHVRQPVSINSGFRKVCTLKSSYRKDDWAAVERRALDLPRAGN